MSQQLSPHPIPLTPFGPGLWLSTEPARILGMKLTATMAVVHLPEGELLIYSPVPLTEARRAGVDALGRVAHLYAPNTFHHLYIGDWAAAYPSARVHAPAALRAKRPDLRIDREHDREPPGALGAALEEIHIDGFALEESVLVHRPSRTLLVADLVHNVGRPSDAWTALYTRAMGFYDQVALSRMIRWTAFSDADAARGSLGRLAACDFDRLVVGHGAPLEAGAHEAVLAAYAWLASGHSALALPGVGAPLRGGCG